MVNPMSLFRHVLTTALIAAALGSGRLIAQETEKKPLDATKIRQQLPRVAPLSPKQSMARMQLHSELRMELVAAEPEVRDPVAIDFDSAGRMYVVQLPPYNAYVIEDFSERGSIRRLEDRDGDGHFETSILFADGLTYPTAVACWDGGIFVGDAPDLLYMKDEDGDGKADLRRVVLTGFGTDRAGEAHLNSIRWGTDQRFHLSTSLSGGDVRAVRNGQPIGKPVSVRGRGLIFDPHRPESFELTTGGGQHGFSMDDWGRGFVCSNSVPAQTFMIDDRYLMRNPELIAPNVVVDIAPDGKFTRLYRISPPEPWRQLRTRLRSEGRFRGSDEGGKPFGFFTGATGITIYRGDAWPARFRGQLFVGDVANNLVYRAQLEPNGLSLTAQRADPEQEFLASRDIWFRPVQFANAPDGCLYILDMYRELIEGAAFLPPEFLETLDAVGGHERGRIWRIAPRGEFKRQRMIPDNASNEELVQLLDHSNGWHRDTASRLLAEVREPDERLDEDLRRKIRNARNSQGRILAASILSSRSVLDTTSLLSLLHDPGPQVRRRAVQLAEQMTSESAAIRNQLVAMVADKDLGVRYQLALTLGAGRGAGVEAALSKLALTDAEYDWMRVALLSSMVESAGRVFEQLMQQSAFARTEGGRKLLLALVSQIGARGLKDQILVAAGAIESVPVEQAKWKQDLFREFVKRMSETDRVTLTAADAAGTSDLMKRFIATARTEAADRTLAVDRRSRAIASLRLIPFGEVEDLMISLLDVQESPRIRVAALSALGGFSDPRASDLLVDRWRQLGPSLRTDAVEILLSRKAGISRLIAAVRNGSVPRSDLDPSRMRLLANHPDAEVRQMMNEFPAAVSNRDGIVAEYAGVLKMKGDASAGRTVFRKHCATCHRLEDFGQAVGAELRGIMTRGSESVLLNILDPNREVKPAYVSYLILLRDGRLITGMIAAENSNSLTLRQTDGRQQVVQRSEVEELRGTGLSLMPEGFEKQINPNDMANLLEYLEQATR